MCAHTRKDKIRKAIQDKIGVIPIKDKMQKSRQRWFEHIKRKCIEAPIRRCERLIMVSLRKGRGG